MEKNNESLVLDHKNNQILSIHCRQCPDAHFQPLSEEFPPIGCCRYEPVFSLFEIWKMVKTNEENFFFEELYYKKNNKVFSYEIIAGANVHSSFYEKAKDGGVPFQTYNRIKENKNNWYKATDLRLRYCSCAFFQAGKGCRLSPAFKTSICRMFICDSIEKHLNEEDLRNFHQFQRGIREEADHFQRVHSQCLKEKGINLQNNVDGVIQYLKRI